MCTVCLDFVWSFQMSVTEDAHQEANVTLTTWASPKYFSFVETVYVFA